MKFTHEKPTVLGAYWFRYNSSSINHISHVWSDGQKLRVEMWNVECYLDELVTGEWSERLVPVGEVEKAYWEAHQKGSAGMNATRDERCEAMDIDWEHSRARRVVEGKEEV